MSKFIDNLRYRNVCITDYTNHLSFFTISDDSNYCEKVMFFDTNCGPLGFSDDGEYYIKILKYKVVYHNNKLVSKNISDINNLPPISVNIIIYKFERTIYISTKVISRRNNPNIKDALRDGDFIRKIKREELRRNDLFFKKCIAKYRFIYRISPSKDNSLINDIREITKCMNENRKTLDLYYKHLRSTGPSGIIMENEEKLCDSFVDKTVQTDDTDGSSVETF